jgi:carboxypeptidase family protein/Big-like domain-containing protein
MVPWSRSLVVLSLCVILASACGSSGGGGNPPPGPTPVTLTSVTVTSSGAPVVGDTVQFTATATFSDGSTQIVSGQATWESSNTAVVTITGGGLATFLAPGEADIRATYRASSGTAMTGTSHVTVTPRTVARHTLTGTVTDATNGNALPNVNARIVDGPDANRSAVTDSNGRFTIADVAAGSFTLQFTRSDYETRSIPVSMSGDTSVTVQITAQTNVTRFHGTYNTALTILQQTCDFPFPVGPTGTFKIEGNANGSSMTITIVERGTTRTYSGTLKGDGSFSGNGGGVIAGFTPPRNRHSYTGSVSGTATGTRVDATEFVTFTDPCPGAKMQIGYSGSK